MKHVMISAEDARFLTQQAKLALVNKAICAATDEGACCAFVPYANLPTDIHSALLDSGYQVELRRAAGANPDMYRISW